MDAGFLDQTLNDFVTTIQNTWGPMFQATGGEILIGIGAIAFGVYAIQLLATSDVTQFILGFAYTWLALALLYAIFQQGQGLATDFYNGMLAWIQEATGLSPANTTPTGVMWTGWALAKIFWNASAAASWFRAPFSAVTDVVCTIVMMVAFFIASIILLFAEIQTWALIVGGAVLLAFAALPWTWGIFPGWGLSVLSSCVKVFFIIAILAVGLTEAQGWANTMTGSAATIAEDATLAVQAMIESVMFLGLIYYIPNMMAGLVLGMVGPVMNAGEAIIGGMAGAAAGGVGRAAMSAASPGAAAGAVQAGANAIRAARATVKSMLRR